MQKKLSFIGVGNMASAIIRGILNSEFISPQNIYLFDINLQKANDFIDLGAHKACSTEDAAAAADCIILAVKPQNYKEVISQLKSVSDIDQKLFISLGAGIPTQYITQALGAKRVVRALPNTPMLCGLGVTALCCGENTPSEDLDFVSSIFSKAGKVLTVKEDEMNKIISVTSSSPAYVFLFIKAMCNGALELGLDDAGIKEAVCNTLIGSASMLLSSDLSADELIKMVASKGGTTERALSELERYSFEEAIASAMKKCSERADELASF